jgi:hypothetical protein
VPPRYGGNLPSDTYWLFRDLLAVDQRLWRCGPAHPNAQRRSTHDQDKPSLAPRINAIGGRFPPYLDSDPYLHLIAHTHHQQVAADDRIGFDALYSRAEHNPEHSPEQPSLAEHTDDERSQQVGR